MSTLRINNIEAQSIPASPTIDEKVKVTNSSGDILVNIDGKTSGITTIGINTTDGNIKFDANSNVLITGILTATTLSGNFTPTSLEVGSNIKLGNAGVITATSFVGSGANLTSLPSQATIANNGNDRIITGGSGVNLNGEANLQFDGTNLFMPNELRHLGDPDTKIGFDTDTIKLETAGSERLRITSDGDVGMDTSPANYSSYKTFTVGAGSVGSIIELRGTTSNFEHLLQNNNGDLIFEADLNNVKASTNVIFKVDGGEKVRITSGGLMGVGTGSPAKNLHVYTSGVATLRIETGDSRGQAWDLLSTNGAGSNTGTLSFRDESGNSYLDFGANGGSPKSVFRNGGSNDLLEIASDGTTTFNPNAGGTLKVGGSSAHTSKIVVADNGGTGNGNCLVEGGDGSDFFTIQSNGNVQFASGNGVQFGSSGEVLDSYEEGNWTPTLNSGSFTAYNLQWYRKIGKLVTCYFYMYNFSGGTSGTGIHIGGLPFAKGNATESFFSVQVGGNPSLPSGCIQVMGRVGQVGNNSIELKLGYTGGGHGTMNYGQAGNGHFAATFSYSA